VAWQTQTVAGYTYDVLMQQQQADCGLCCVAMVVNLRGGGKPTSAAVKQLLDQGAYNPATADRAGFKPSLLTAVVSPPVTGSPGTVLPSLKAALARYQIASTITGPASMATGLATVTPRNPLITHITWNNGTGHWVVVARVAGTAQFILDPAYGFRINSSPTDYSWVQQGATPGKVAVNAYGRFTGWWLRAD
jgi:ABC-type bacteriocin/lantibiotic exporter with double-glycine peptidase domain